MEAQAALVAGTLMGLAFVNMVKPVAAVIIKKPPSGGLSTTVALRHISVSNLPSSLFVCSCCPVSAIVAEAKV